MRTVYIIGGLIGLVFAPPALADDWSLSCTYTGGVEAIIEYDAGWPRYTVAVTKAGGDLKLTKALRAGRISTPNSLLLFVSREGEPLQERNMLVRIHTETMRSTIEAGSGGFDYLGLEGVCREL